MGQLTITPQSLYRTALDRVAQNHKVEKAVGYGANISTQLIVPYDPTSMAIYATEATIELIQTQDTIGDAVLYALWRLFSDGVYLFYGECSTLREFVDTYIVPKVDATPRYLQALCFVIERVFVGTNKAIWKRKPFITPDGEIITPELLLSQPGLVGKLRDISPTFAASATDHDQRQQLLTAVLTMKQEDVVGVRERISKGGRSLIPAHIRQLDVETVEVTMRMTKKDYELVNAALKRIWNPTLS